MICKTGMGDALKKLDKLTQEEFWMIHVENLVATYRVNEGVRVVAGQVNYCV